VPRCRFQFRRQQAREQDIVRQPRDRRQPENTCSVYHTGKIIEKKKDMLAVRDGKKPDPSSVIQVRAHQNKGIDSIGHPGHGRHGQVQSNGQHELRFRFGQ